MSKHGPGSNSMVFILVTILIDAIGFGIIIPVMPALLTELLDLPSEAAAPWSGYLGFAYAAMHFVFGPMIGSLSDRFGRRPVLLLSLAALVFDYLVMGFATSIWVLFVGRILCGICGATYPTANAYIADVTSADARTRAFGKVGAAFGIGFILGPALGGLLGELDPRAPFFAAAALSFLNMIFGYFVLPESLSVENRRPFDLARANPLGAFKHFAKLPTLTWLFVTCFLYSFAHIVYPATWNFHADARYGWDSGWIGLSLMAFGVCSALVQGALLGQFLKRMGVVKTAILGVVLNIIAFIGFAFASESWMLFAWIPISALGAIAGPSINSIMSSRVGAESQGELQGAIASAQAVSNMFSPLLMTHVFAYFLWEGAPIHFHGAAFILAAILALISLGPLIFGTNGNNKVAESAA